MSEELKLALELTSGQSARLVSYDHDRATVESPLAFPPGSTLRAHLPGVSCEFQLKVRDCQLQQPGPPRLFKVSGRLQNATRELRARLSTRG